MSFFSQNYISKTFPGIVFIVMAVIVDVFSFLLIIETREFFSKEIYLNN